MDLILLNFFCREFIYLFNNRKKIVDLNSFALAQTKIAFVLIP